MNVESILNKIQLFEELVIDSGFRRDIVDFVQTIQQAQNKNLVFMKGLSERVQASLAVFENNSLGPELDLILRDSASFTSRNTADELKELDFNKKIDSPQYFQKINDIFNVLLASIDANTSEINIIKKVFSKYVSDKSEFQTEEEQALVSLVFKDLKSTGGLKEFSRVLNRWNNTLLVLHQLMTSESPEEISLVEIQNGSIDVIFNIDVNIAIDLTNLIKTGLQVYGAYLLYKSNGKVKEIVGACFGNKELMKLEEKRETLMLNNIKLSIKEKALELHEKHKVSDKDIDKTAIDIKVETISSTITDHIIKGNEIKILTLLKPDEEAEEGGNTAKDILTELRESTAIVRERAKELSPAEQQLLLKTYAIKEDD